MNQDRDGNSPMESDQFVMNRVGVIIVAASTNKDAHHRSPSFGHSPPTRPMLKNTRIAIFAAVDSLRGGRMVTRRSTGRGQT
jgi:hypothetical protein